GLDADTVGRAACETRRERERAVGRQSEIVAAVVLKHEAGAKHTAERSADGVGHGSSCTSAATCTAAATSASTAASAPTASSPSSAAAIGAAASTTTCRQHSGGEKG